MYKSFGEHLREERKRQGLTVQDTSALCGTSRSYFTLIENGKRLPGKKIIPKIAVALKLKTAVVLNWYLEEIRYRIEDGVEE